MANIYIWIWSSKVPKNEALCHGSLEEDVGVKDGVFSGWERQKYNIVWDKNTSP